MRVVAVFASMVLALPVAAQNASQRAQIEEVLATSKLREVVGTLGDQLFQAVTQRAPDMDAVARARVREAIDRHFAADSLYGRVLRAFEADVEPAQLAALRGWLLAPPIRAIDAKIDAYEPPESLEEYAQRLQREGPSQHRVQLADRLAASQRAGEFYYAITDAVDVAARASAAAVRGEAPAQTERTPAEVEQAIRQYRIMGIISFLQRLEPLTDEEFATMVQSYESESGRWYAETYKNALRTALAGAGSAVADALR